MREALRAGCGVYNDGYYHAAHDAWEDHWLGLESGSDDERLLHGLIQFTAAVHHARGRNWEGAVGLAESAGGYLAGLPATYRDVDLGPVRGFLEDLASDPEVVERRPPPQLVFDGETPHLADLEPAETVRAAGVLAEAFGYDEGVLERAGEYALAELEAEGEGETGTRFLALVTDFVREEGERALVYQRLEAHVERRNSKEEDVEGLF